MSDTASAAPAAPAASKHPPDVRGFWRTLLAVIAPVPAAAIAVSTLVAPYSGDESADILAGAADHPGAMTASVWLSGLAVLTLVPATIAVVLVCRRRAPRLTAVGGAVSVLGFSAAFMLPDEELDALTAADKHLDRATMLALADGVWSQPPVVTALILFLVGMVVGGILLGVALWRSRVAPTWMALALIVSSPLHLVLPSGVTAVTALGWALTAVGYAAASLALLRTPNDEFDLPPVAAAARTAR
jgi:hypothetical protein